MKKRMIAAMLTAMTALSVFGVTAMADDDELVLFTWENMFPQEVLDGFTEETGIKVDLIPTLTPRDHAGEAFSGKGRRLRRDRCR